MNLAVRAGRRAHGDVEYAGGARRDDAHHDRARIGSTPSGHVHGGGADGHFAQPDPLALGQGDRPLVADGGGGDLGNVGDRHLQSCDDIQRQPLDGLVELLR